MSFPRVKSVERVYDGRAAFERVTVEPLSGAELREEVQTVKAESE